MPLVLITGSTEGLGLQAGQLLAADGHAVTLHARNAARADDARTALPAAAVARRWPDVLSNAVDPGWVATRMGGSGASDDLAQGPVTQTWLAVTEDDEARSSGGYWYRRTRRATHPAVSDVAVQDGLLAACAS